MDSEQIKQQLINDLAQATASADLEALRVKYLGKTGIVSNLMAKIGSIPVEERKTYGAKVNEIKLTITDLIQNKKQIIDEQELQEKLCSERVDISLPARQFKTGKIHPITQAIEEVIAIFSQQGFKVAQGPSIESDYYNFTALNIDEHHPARQMHDTFYMPNNNDETMVLRTQTSAVQIREMQKGKPPFKLIVPGRTYRSDWDQTHTPMFHQIECLYIDKNINFGHLKGVIINFLKAFFENDQLNFRFRPSFFPFTEPSAEVDISYSKENGQIKLGKGEHWLEVLGCGMVHPTVLENVGLDPQEWQGFAFGAGVERLAMLKYSISDLRQFFESDLRWLNNYGFNAFDIPNLVGGLSR